MGVLVKGEANGGTGAAALQSGSAMSVARTGGGAPAVAAQIRIVCDEVLANAAAHAFVDGAPAQRSGAGYASDGSSNALDTETLMREETGRWRCARDT